MSTETGRKKLSLSEALIDNQFDNVALEQGNWVPRRNKNSSKKKLCTWKQATYILKWYDQESVHIFGRIIET